MRTIKIKIDTACLEYKLLLHRKTFYFFPKNYFSKTLTFTSVKTRKRKTYKIIRHLNKLKLRKQPTSI